MAFNFKDAESAKEINFLKPGVYNMKVSEVKLGTFPKGKTYLGIELVTEDGQKLLEKMGFDWNDEKAKQNEIFLSRLQYFHEAWSGKRCEKNFKTPAEIEEYFSRNFVNSKNAGSRNIIVGGNIATDGKVYAELPFTSYILDKDADLEIGEFEEGGTNWKKYVKKSNYTSEAAGKKNGLLNDVNEVSASKNGKAKVEAEAGEDTPW